MAVAVAAAVAQVGLILPAASPGGSDLISLPDAEALGALPGAASASEEAASGAKASGGRFPQNFSFFMQSEAEILTEGTIIAVLPGTMFRVELDQKHVVLAHISGKMRKRFIRLNRGDRVKLEMSPYDLTKARIVYRLQ